jgi:predicted ribosome quality control (RQC) complex YloA/Tae2 family protein
MLTDWVLIGRLAEELERALRGARVEDAGLLPDGRTALLFRTRGTRALLAVDLFSSPPMVTVEEGELGILTEPGFVRALARALQGMVLVGVASRRNDRLLRLTFAARSRFGVGDSLDLYLELVPRFGNVVLVKDATVVAASKEFSPSENPQRPVQAGSPYFPPPLPQNPRTLDAQPAGSVLELFARERRRQLAHRGDERIAVRRRAALKRLAQRERKLLDELESLAAKRLRAARRDELRARGEAVFATLHELPDSERDEAKERAAQLFAEYRRYAKMLPHLDSRESSVRSSLEAVETLRWEAERAASEDFDAVESAIAELGVRPDRHAPARTLRRKRAPLEFRTARGSRIVVGRSPLENAELTFRVARPNDLWFHTQRIPGAHVILSRDDRADAPPEDLEAAAALAAFHSRARGAATVAVDYTLRKHVRKQRAAPPGLVWYTHAKTLVVEPREDPLSERATMGK